MKRVQYDPATGMRIEAELTPEEKLEEAASSGAVLAQSLGLTLLTTTDSPAGWTVVDVKGIVVGNTIRTRHVGAKVLAGVSAAFGGELGGYTRLLREARDQALERMAAAALGVGANAVIGVQFATTDVFESAAEIFAYGTAVTVELVTKTETSKS